MSHRRIDTPIEKRLLFQTQKATLRYTCRFRMLYDPGFEGLGSASWSPLPPPPPPPRLSATHRSICATNASAGIPTSSSSFLCSAASSPATTLPVRAAARAVGGGDGSLFDARVASSSREFDFDFDFLSDDDVGSVVARGAALDRDDARAGGGGGGGDGGAAVGYRAE